AEALGMTNLNGGTLCNAEFGIRHRAAPYRKGQVLHSVFAAAHLNVIKYKSLFAGDIVKTARSAANDSDSQSRIFVWNANRVAQ
ncbi:hypothetical protein, partial [Pseudomonas sp. 5Ae-yellow]|uniref:hypothetical protein n=1 Tax=Pseudomonas sp. 5Ae-yellow TaxID=2759848 RepID=UPI001C71498A